MTNNISINKRALRSYLCYKDAYENINTTMKVCSTNNSLIATYIHSAYGSIMPGRYFSSGTRYAWGFNGKEMDNEVKGVGNNIDFGARIYDSRLSKFLSIDPLSSKFVDESNYLFAGNSPIYFIDIEGKFKISATNIEYYRKQYPLIIKYLETQVEKDICNSTFTRFYMLLIHEFAHNNNWYTGPGLLDTKTGRYTYTNLKVHDYENGYKVEQDIWGHENYKPFDMNNDPRPRPDLPHHLDIKAFTFEKGCTEGIIENSQKTEAGRASLPTVPKH